jgi:hypothetical protein
MKIFQEGDKSKAFCHDCAAIVETTFMRRNVPFNDGTGVVKNILSGVCDVCKRVVSVPAQSTAATVRRG